MVEEDEEKDEGVGEGEELGAVEEELAGPAVGETSRRRNGRKEERKEGRKRGKVTTASSSSSSSLSQIKWREKFIQRPQPKHELLMMLNNRLCWCVI